MSNGIGLEDLQQGTKWWGGKGYGIGDKISGVVVSAERAQQRDFDTGTPMEWDNGDPRMETVIIVGDTGLVDPEMDNDTGERALHLRGGNFKVAEGTGLAGEVALREAMKKAGIRCEPGCKIQAVITGLAEPTGRGKNPAKLFTIKLEAPAKGISEADLFE